jgi:putative transcriptional regulator
MNCDDLQQLTAIRALGALDGDEFALLEKRLAEDDLARMELARFFDVAATLALVSVPKKSAPPALREKILDRIRQTPQLKAGPQPPAPETKPGLPDFSFMRSDAPWMDAPMPGIRLKVLSLSENQGYAMLLVELAAGVVYPEHEHEGTEDTYVLSGDLQFDGRALGPGDSFHAEPGSHHKPMTTLDGCTAIFIVPRKAFLAMAG